MNLTDRSLMQQMQISIIDIERRKQLLGLMTPELKELERVRVLIEPGLDHMIDEFYIFQTSIPEINSIIGDSDTLKRLKVVQHQYILDLFSGYYDSHYVNNRLRIGLVHKRIGVEPRFYLAALHHLKVRLFSYIQVCLDDQKWTDKVVISLEKLFMFDMTLVFETYVWSLVNEVKSSKDKLQEYANALGAHAQEMEGLSRIDPLTGLLNVRDLMPLLNEVIYRAQQELQPLTVVFIDINDFKKMNDEYGHMFGDQVIQAVATALKHYARDEDYCFRYGGDEFLVVLPNCTEDSAQSSFIPRVLDHLTVLQNEVRLSIGLHQIDSKSGYIDSSSLIREADCKMYEVKKKSKYSNL